MANSMCLTAEEVQDLTGRVQHGAQSKVLRSMGIEHRARPDGSVAVLRSHCEDVLSGGGKPNGRSKPEPKINWSGINASRSQ